MVNVVNTKWVYSKSCGDVWLVQKEFRDIIWKCVLLSEYILMVYGSIYTKL